MDPKMDSKILWIAVWAVIVLNVFQPPDALAQLEIKLNDTVNMKFGFLVQGTGDWTENPVGGAYAQNLYLRRLRFIISAQITPDITFFYLTDNPNLGKASGTPPVKTISSGLIAQDAILTWRMARALGFDLGLMIIPLCRNCDTNAAFLLPIDYGAYTYSSSVPEQSVNGRDTGAQARGYLLGDHLEYRFGIFEGNRSSANNAFRSAGRVQLDLLDPEVGFLYTGAYLGQKRVLAIGIGYDLQKDYRAYASDVFLDHPLGPGSVTAQFDYLVFDGGSTLPTLAQQHDWLAEGGYYVTAVKLMPWLKVEDRRVIHIHLQNEERYQVGLTYYFLGNNINIKGGFGRVHDQNVPTANLFTVQLQGYVF